LSINSQKQIVGMGCITVFVILGALGFAIDSVPLPLARFIIVFCIGMGIYLLIKNACLNEKAAENQRLKNAEAAERQRQKDAEVAVEKKKNLQELSQNALNAYREKADELAAPHLKTLCKKKKRLVTSDDYGVLNTERWDAEIEYFCDRVLRNDPELLSLEESVIKHQTALVEFDVFLEDPRTALIKFIDAVVDIRLESYASEIAEYSDDITPVDYEHFCADILNNCGWQATVTKLSGDQGIDIVAEKDNIKLAIQCKKYSKPVGNKAVQEAYSGAAFYEATACAVVAPIEFTPAAIELANTLGVHLLHHDDLADLSITSNKSCE